MGGGKFYYLKRLGYTDSILFIKHSKYYLSFFRIPDGISQVYSNFFPLITCRVGNGDSQDLGVLHGQLFSSNLISTSTPYFNIT